MTLDNLVVPEDEKGFICLRFVLTEALAQAEGRIPWH